MDNKKKIAFCFLSYGDIEHMDIWQRFFEEGLSSIRPTGKEGEREGEGEREREREATCTIFLHTVEPLTASALPGARLIPRMPTAWGQFSLVEVQQSMFDIAFADPAIYKAVLLSGDSIPLYKYGTIYERLCSDDKGYLRYGTKPPLTAVQINEKYRLNLSAWPADRPWTWSLTSQWIVLNRKQYDILHDNFAMLRAVFGSSEIPDEHVYSVFFEGFDLLGTFHARDGASHVYVDWTIFDRPRPNFRKPPNRIPFCRLNHRKKPWTYHAYDLDRAEIATIYDSGCMFLRKICRNTVLKMDWASERILHS